MLATRDKSQWGTTVLHHQDSWIKNLPFSFFFFFYRKKRKIFLGFTHSLNLKQAQKSWFIIKAGKLNMKEFISQAPHEFQQLLLLSIHR